ncbi:hypothetical protein NM688_g746 [Phlebia brevispora]|uniref:Uncharacterized protein n=1 Tax=Phlebia brevispora TaxID=194682 RepID=A0ACC1TDS1_9APHY|nr:hypothetical protein NM688_g746 [Phlebia brevispora]
MARKPLSLAQRKHKSSSTKEAKICAALQDFFDAQSIARGQPRTIREIAQARGVDRVTLWRRIHGGRSILEFNKGKQTFSPAEEAVLVEFVRTLALRQLPLTHELLHAKANSILALRHSSITVAKCWSYRFLDRHHGELSMYWSSGMDNKHGHALDPRNAKDYFDMLTEICKKNNIKTKFKFVMDESPIMLGRSGSRQRVIGPVGQKRQPCLQDDSRDSLSLVVAVCADGSLAMRPTVIFQGKNFMKKWNEHNHSNVTIDVLPNGYMDEELNLAWMKDFERDTRPSGTEANEWRLLAVDNFSSHLSLAVLDLAREHRIEMIGYIPHSTHLLQGLDITCFGTFKTLYGEARQKYEHETGLQMMKEAFLDILKEPFDHAFTAAAIKAAFRVTGIEPLNSEVITPAMTAPSAECSAAVAFPLELPSPVRAVLPYFRALQEQPGDPPEPRTPSPPISESILTEPVTPTRNSQPQPSLVLTPHGTRADIQQMTPRTKQHTLEARKSLRSSSAGFLTKPSENLSSQCRLPQPCIANVPQPSDNSQQLLYEPTPTLVKELQVQNTKLREALLEAKGHIDAAGRIIEAQNVTMALQAIGYEEQRTKIGVKETRMRSNREKLLVTKTGRHLTGDEFRAAAAEDTAARETRKSQAVERKKAKQAKALLKRARDNWRAKEVAERKVQRAADLKEWKQRCEACKAKRMKQPKMPRAPKRAATPEEPRIQAADTNRSEGDKEEGEDGSSSEDDDVALDDD